MGYVGGGGVVWLGMGLAGRRQKDKRLEGWGLVGRQGSSEALDGTWLWWLSLECQQTRLFRACLGCLDKSMQKVNKYTGSPHVEMESNAV